jgi:hypothetical protein
MAYTWYELADGADSTLTAAINNTATTMTLTDATEFPASGDFLVTIWDPIGHDEPADDANMEIVKCTSRTGNVLTIERGFGETSAAAHNESDRAGLYDNKAIVEQITDFIDAGAYTELSVSVDPQYPEGTIFGSYGTNGIRSVVEKETGDGNLNYSITGISGSTRLYQLGGILGNITGGYFTATLSEGGCTNVSGIYSDASAFGGTVANDIIGAEVYARGTAAIISGDLISIKAEVSGTATGDVVGLLIDDTTADYAIKQSGTAKSSLAAIDIGDGTNYTEIKADGEINLHGTARVKKRIMLSCPTGTTPPDEVITTYFTGWSFDIGDDARAQSNAPADWDPTTGIDIYIAWYIDESYATGNGEIQWDVSAGNPASGESILTPTRSATAATGDINIPTTANTLVKTLALNVPYTALITDSIMGISVERIALTDGSDPTADPVVVGIILEYTSSKLGAAT